MVARICDMVLRPTLIVNGQPTVYEFAALIQYCSPETGQVVVTETKSNDFAAGFQDNLTSSYHVGDYVTAIYLDSDPTKTLRLYGSSK